MLLQPWPKTIASSLDRFDQHDWTASFNGLPGAFERFHFHSLNVDLDQIHARKVQRVQCHFLDTDCLFSRIVDRLANKFVVEALSQLKTAETRRRQIVRIW